MEGVKEKGGGGAKGEGRVMEGKGEGALK